LSLGSYAHVHPQQTISEIENALGFVGEELRGDKRSEDGGLKMANGRKEKRDQAMNLVICLRRRIRQD
jgi:hypothetical protein